MTERFTQLRLVEALLFASAEPLGRAQLMRHLPEETDLDELMGELAGLYANRGVNLVHLGERWAFRSAPDLAPLMQIETTVERKPTRAAVETLAIIAYHQPVTRAEIEEVRGVALSRGTLDTLLEAGWIKPKGRRRTPGKPVTWGTTEAFLDHFGLESLESLPGLAELKAAGLIDARPAVSALSARGELLAPEEAGEDSERAEAAEAAQEGEEPELAEALAADFGEDLVAEAEAPETETLETETPEAETLEAEGPGELDEPEEPEELEEPEEPGAAAPGLEGTAGDHGAGDHGAGDHGGEDDEAVLPAQRYAGPAER